MNGVQKTLFKPAIWTAPVKREYQAAAAGWNMI